jgi:hypothetical protein
MDNKEIDMSPEAITNRLGLMEQLWELSVSLMSARPVELRSEAVSNKESVETTEASINY